MQECHIFYVVGVGEHVNGLELDKLVPVGAQRFYVPRLRGGIASEDPVVVFEKNSWFGQDPVLVKEG